MTHSLGGFDFNQMEPDWLGRIDVGRAGAAAKAYLKLVAEGRIDPVKTIKWFRVALDRELDGPEGDPRTVLAALEAAALAFRDAETKASTAQRIGLRSSYLTISTRTLHRLGYAREAGRRALQNMVYLEDQSRGQTGLLQALSDPESNVIAENAVDAIPAALAAWRRMNYDDKTNAWLFGQAREWFGAYMMSEHPPVIYGRTCAFAAQYTYYFGDEGSPEDAPLMRAAYDLDIASRGKDARSQTTIHRREFAFHKFFGDLERAIESRAAALAAFRAYPLPRHLGSAGG